MLVYQAKSVIKVSLELIKCGAKMCQQLIIEEDVAALPRPDLNNFGLIYDQVIIRVNKATIPDVICLVVLLILVMVLSASFFMYW